MALPEILPHLGHRNWVAVVDAAFPELVAPGVTTLVGGSLESTVDALNASAHIRYEVLIDAELEFLQEPDCPGIEAFRCRLDRLLEEMPVVRQPHDEIIKTIEAVAGTFRVVVVKTDCLLPYTSVFFRLGCGYWGTVQEAELRSRMPSV